MTEEDVATRLPGGIPTDLADVGVSTVLLMSMPMVAVLVQCVAESESDWNYLNLSVQSGAWVGVCRRASETELTVSTNGGSRPVAPYEPPLHEALLEHGFVHDPQDESYTQQVSFETDGAFLATARLIVGTFQHAYGSDLRETVSVQLVLQP